MRAMRDSSKIVSAAEFVPAASSQPLGDALDHLGVACGCAPRRAAPGCAAGRVNRLNAACPHTFEAVPPPTSAACGPSRSREISARRRGSVPSLFVLRAVPPLA